MDASMTTTTIEHVGHIAIAILAVPFVYALFRAAGLGWFRTKYEYQRRLMSGLKKESCYDGE